MNKLRPNYRRILESILYLINEATRRNLYVTQYDIVKSIFLADVSHLNRYGRPITFDNYVAMKDGPVATTVFDIIKPSYSPRQHFKDEKWPPWDRVPSPQDGKNAFRYINPRRRENRRLLSETDINALSEALGNVKALRFSGTRDLTHDHPAYKAVWKETPDRKAFDMDYAALLETPDDALLEEIVIASYSQ